MANVAAPRVSLRRYVKTLYRPDRDYIHGVLEKRNLGEFSHSLVVTNLICFFGDRERNTGMLALPSIRLRLGATLIRVTDVGVFSGKPDEQIPSRSPLACIEVLSTRDRFSPMNARLRDYLGFGVRNVWLIDPEAHRVWVYGHTFSIREATESVRLEGTDIEVPLPEMFE